jgi:hypothetical protein
VLYSLCYTHCTHHTVLTIPYSPYYTPRWFSILDFVVDVIVIAEVVSGMAYLGRDYWLSTLNRIDFAIAAVCVVNVICFFAPFDEKDEVG